MRGFIQCSGLDVNGIVYETDSEWREDWTEEIDKEV